MGNRQAVYTNLAVCQWDAVQYCLCDKNSRNNFFVACDIFSRPFTLRTYAVIKTRLNEKRSKQQIICCLYNVFSRPPTSRPHAVIKETQHEDPLEKKTFAACTLFRGLLLHSRTRSQKRASIRAEHPSCSTLCVINKDAFQNSRCTHQSSLKQNFSKRAFSLGIAQANQRIQISTSQMEIAEQICSISPYHNALLRESKQQYIIILTKQHAQQSSNAPLRSQHSTL